MAPVEGSGSTPAWMAFVPNFIFAISNFFGFNSEVLFSFTLQWPKDGKKARHIQGIPICIQD